MIPGGAQRFGDRSARRTSSGVVAGDVDRVVFRANADSLATAEAKPKSKCGPGSGKYGIEPKRLSIRLETEEAVGERLPQSAHRGEVQSDRGRAGEVVQVEASGDPEQLERPFGLSAAGVERRGDRRGERAAVRRAGFVELKARRERSGDHLIGYEVVEP